ncbi:putative isomerase [Drosera capensis]
MANTAGVKYAVVDAFTDSAFKGNPAAVCLLEEDKPGKWLQSVAREFNISETCYLTRVTDSDQTRSSVISRIKLLKEDYATVIQQKQAHSMAQ